MPPSQSSHAFMTAADCSGVYVSIGVAGPRYSSRNLLIIAPRTRLGRPGWTPYQHDGWPALDRQARGDYFRVRNHASTLSTYAGTRSAWRRWAAMSPAASS